MRNSLKIKTHIYEIKIKDYNYLPQNFDFLSQYFFCLFSSFKIFTLFSKFRLFSHHFDLLLHYFDSILAKQIPKSQVLLLFLFLRWKWSSIGIGPHITEYNNNNNNNNKIIITHSPALTQPSFSIQYLGLKTSLR